MIENNSLSEIHKRTPIINELSPKAKFTKLTIASGVNGVVYHNILGAPHQHMSDMLEK